MFDCIKIASVPYLYEVIESVVWDCVPVLTADESLADNPCFDQTLDVYSMAG